LDADDDVEMQFTTFREEIHVNKLPSRTGENVDSFAESWVNSINKRVLAVVIDRRILGAHQQRMSDFHENYEMAHVSGTSQYPYEMARLIYCLLSAISNNHKKKNNANDTTTKTTDKKKKTTKKIKKKDEDLMDLEAEEEEEEPPAEEAAFSSSIMEQSGGFFMSGSKHNQVILENVEVYIQDIPSREDDKDILGWRIIFAINDINFNFGYELFSLIRFFENDYQERMSKKKNQIDENSIENLRVNSWKEWISVVMHCYLIRTQSDFKSTYSNEYKKQKLVSDNLINHPEVRKRYDDLNNPINVNNAFSIKRSAQIIMDLFGDRVNSALYNFNDFEHVRRVNNIAEFHFFGKGAVRKIGAYDKNPIIFHHALLWKDPLAELYIKSIELTKNIDYEITKQHNHIITNSSLFSNGLIDVIDGVAQINTDFLKVDGNNYLKLHQDASFKTRLKSLFVNPDNLSPAHGSIVRWILKQQSIYQLKNNNQKWSAMRENHRPLQSNDEMTAFSHYMTRMLFSFECVFSMGTLHKELGSYMITRLAALYIKGKNMMPHGLLSGVAAAGKSKILDEIVNCSIEGTYRRVAHETAKAYTADANYDHMMSIYDEVSSQLTDKGEDGQGNNLLKTLMTTGRLQTTAYGSDENTHRRRTDDYVAKVRMLILSAGNICKHSLAEPIQSRVNVEDTPRYNRKVDFALKERELDCIDEDINLYETFTEEYKLIQALVGCVEVLIASNCLPDVYMDSALMKMNQFKNRLNDEGVFLEPRKDQVIQSQIRTCAIVEAVVRVFFVPKCWKLENTPLPAFSFEQLLEVLPYLYATEEHVTYVLSEMEHLIMDNLIDDIVKSVSRLSRNKESDGSFTRIYYENENSEKEFNYYFIRMKNIELSIDSLLIKLARMIRADISLYEKKIILEQNILGVLKWLMTQTKDVNMYETEDKHYTPPKTKIVHYMGCELKMAKAGCFFSRDFINDSINRMKNDKDTNGNSMSYVTKLISDCLDTSTTADRILLIGKTFRSKNKMVPYVFNTIHRKKNPKQVEEFIDLKYRKPGFDRMVRGNIANLEIYSKTPTMQIPKGYHIDDYFYETYFQKIAGFDLDSIFNFPVDRRWKPNLESYPKFYLDLEKTKYEDDKENYGDDLMIQKTKIKEVVNNSIEKEKDILDQQQKDISTTIQTIQIPQTGDIFKNL
jgi:hypothetical protein